LVLLFSFKKSIAKFGSIPTLASQSVNKIIIFSLSNDFSSNHSEAIIKASQTAVPCIFILF
jgi:hypothetical protein